jgi:hypothetical protein
MARKRGQWNPQTSVYVQGDIADAADLREANLPAAAISGCWRGL